MDVYVRINGIVSSSKVSGRIIFVRVVACAISSNERILFRFSFVDNKLLRFFYSGYRNSVTRPTIFRIFFPTAAGGGSWERGMWGMFYFRCGGLDSGYPRKVLSKSRSVNIPVVKS